MSNNKDQFFKPMLQLSEIWIYPIKSLGGISLAQAQLTDRGLANDRRWLLVDENNQFLSQREHPQLALFQLALHEETMQVMYTTNGSTISFPLQIKEYQNPLSVTVWDDTMLAYEVASEVSNWFTKTLGF
ncbi:MAG: MOSC N-terminal beta barrel domain-containing protein, partial [Thermoguttaceae bacterium]